MNLTEIMHIEVYNTNFSGSQAYNTIRQQKYAKALKKRKYSLSINSYIFTEVHSFRRYAT